MYLLLFVILDFSSFSLSSPHPYDSNTYVVEEISFDGAIYMSVSFGPGNEIENDADFIRLYLDPYLLESVGDVYTGTNFPGQGLDTLNILGSQFYFTFISDTGTEHYGYDMTVTPVYGKFFINCWCKKNPFI